MFESGVLGAHLLVCSRGAMRWRISTEMCTVQPAKRLMSTVGKPLDINSEGM